MVSTQLKIMSQIGSFSRVGLKIKNIWKHHLDVESEKILPSWLFFERYEKEDKLILAKSWYFTNLHFPEIKEISLTIRYLLGFWVAWGAL